MNDVDRAEWIDNDEYLYRWWKAARVGKASFIRENRDELTEYIKEVGLGGKDHNSFFIEYWRNR